MLVSSTGKQERDGGAICKSRRDVRQTPASEARAHASSREFMSASGTSDAGGLDRYQSQYGGVSRKCTRQATSGVWNMLGYTTRETALLSVQTRMQTRWGGNCDAQVRVRVSFFEPLDESRRAVAFTHQSVSARMRSRIARAVRRTHVACTVRVLWTRLGLSNFQIRTRLAPVTKPARVHFPCHFQVISALDLQRRSRRRYFAHLLPSNVFPRVVFSLLYNFQHADFVYEGMVGIESDLLTLTVLSSVCKTLPSV